MPKQNPTPPIDNQEVTEVIEWLIQAGFLTDQSIKNKDIRIADAERQKQLYHNTKLLLRHYRDIIWILESFPGEISEELQEPVKDLDKIIDQLSRDMDTETSEYIGRLKSVNKSRQLIELVHRAMMTLKNKPNGGERMYYTIYFTYFYKNKLTVQEALSKIMEAEKSNYVMSERSYYYIRKKAINILSLCLWSSPNKALDSWISLSIMLKKANSSRN